MSDTLRVWTCYFTRSEWGPLQPMLNVADEMDVDLHVQNVTDVTNPLGIEESLSKFEPHVVLCPFDRPEMALMAYYAYHLDYPIAQTFVGDVAGGAYDDADRFAITNYATYLFCSDRAQFDRTVSAMRWRQSVDWRTVIEISGPTHFDNMKYTEHGESNYTLVLYNPPSLAKPGQIEQELEEIVAGLPEEEQVYWVEPNGDRYSDMVNEYAKTYSYLPNMDRQDFLGWLRHASMIVGNSSCMYYEAPYLGVPFRQVGIRNLHREKIHPNRCKPGASKHIFSTLRREVMG